MKRNIGIIPTSYSGIQFRSATEARFAKWCDSKGLRWLYEPDGFEFGGTRYLPDFYIPSGRWVIEIKPPMFMEECWKIRKMRIALPNYHYVIGTMEHDTFRWASHSDWNGYEDHSDGKSWVDYGPDSYTETPDGMWYCKQCTRPFFPTTGSFSCPHCNYYDGDSGFVSTMVLKFNGFPLPGCK